MAVKLIRETGSQRIISDGELILGEFLYKYCHQKYNNNAIPKGKIHCAVPYFSKFLHGRIKKAPLLYIHYVSIPFRAVNIETTYGKYCVYRLLTLCVLLCNITRNVIIKSIIRCKHFSLCYLWCYVTLPLKPHSILIYPNKSCSSHLYYAFGTYAKSHNSFMTVVGWTLFLNLAPGHGTCKWAV